MELTKILHSTILIEQASWRLLIDPGDFTFVEKKIAVEDIPPIDVILLTHEHTDHYSPDALKAILRKKKAMIYTHERLHELLKEQGIESTIIKDNIIHGPFTIRPVTAPHGTLPVVPPHNCGFLISENVTHSSVFHPGDSLDFPILRCTLLCLPIAGPWLTLKQALDKAKEVKPRIAIPIHDVFIKEFMLERMYTMCQKVFAELGIQFLPLKVSEKYSLPAQATCSP